MLPSQRSESLNAISSTLADLHLGSANRDSQRNHSRNRIRSSNTADCLVGNKLSPSGAQLPKPVHVLSGGVKKHARHNFSFSNARFYEIQRENRRLLGEILKKTTSLPNAVRQRPRRPSSASFSRVAPILLKNAGRRVSDTNAVSFYARQKERQRIEMENLALHQRLQSIRNDPGSGMVQKPNRYLKRASSVPRFASCEHLDLVNDSLLDEQNVSSFEV